MMPMYDHRMKKGLLSAAVLLAAVLIFWAGPAHSEGGQTAPDFSLSDLNGRMHRLSDYRGKVVVLNFWAAWCIACIEELPSLNTLHEQMKGRDVAVLGISIDRKEKAARETAYREKISYPVLLDRKGEVFVGKYTVTSLPATFIIDREGVVRDILKGRTDFTSRSVIDRIQAILDKRI